MGIPLKYKIALCFYFIYVTAYGQISISPRITVNHNYYDWNTNIGSFTDPREWTYGIGILSRAPVGDKIYAGLSFNFYPFGYKIFDDNTEPNTITANIFDSKVSLEYELYPKTLLGIGIELEMLTQIRRTGNFNQIPIPADSQRHFGAEVSLTQRIGKVELFAEVFIGINEIGNNPPPIGSFGHLLTFRSHKKLQMGIGIPFGMK